MTWSARKIHPRTIGYVILVFLAFILVAHFLVHSPEAVLALATAAVGSIVPLLPGVLNRTEFQLTEEGLLKRTPKEQKKKTGAFSQLFSWSELSHLVPRKDGFKFYKTLEASGWLDRFWKLYISDRWTGEFQVEKEDRPRVEEFFSAREIPLRNPRKLP